MSQYGTHPEYERGWDVGFDEASDRYKPLVKAARALLKRWETNKNMSEQAQALAAALKEVTGK